MSHLFCNCNSLSEKNVLFEIGQMDTKKITQIGESQSLGNIVVFSITLCNTDSTFCIQPIGSYAYKDDQWAAFNDVIDIQEKATYVRDRFLGGVLVFVLDHDDFQNECGCENYPLLKTINRVFNNETESSGRNCSLFANPRLNVTLTNLTYKPASKCPT